MKVVFRSRMQIWVYVYTLRGWGMYFVNMYSWSYPGGGLNPHPPRKKILGTALCICSKKFMNFLEKQGKN
jgi:hypothetical protein